MQLSNLVGMYNNSTSQPVKASAQMGTQKLVSSLSELTQGNIFEGTVNSIKGGRVLLGLSNGQTLSARLDASISLTQGQSLFFQVKSNDGNTIAIRPFTLNGNQVNLTMMNALSQANLSINESNLTMVNSMMEKAMPVDRDSLAQMARLVSNNPTANVETLVEMTNLKLPTTPEMISQFENYANDRQAITNELNQFMEELPNSLANQNLSVGEMAKTASDVLQILTENLSFENGEPLPNVALEQNAETDVAQQGVIQQDVTQQDVTQQTVSQQTVSQQPSVDIQGANHDVLQQAEAEAEPGATEQAMSASLEKEVLVNASPGSLGSLFNTNQLSNLTNNLFEANLLPNNQTLVPEQNAMELLNQIAMGLSNLSDADKASLVKLFLSGEFQDLSKEAMKQQWTLKPQDLAGSESDKVSKLYEHLKNQLNRIESAVRATGQESNSLIQTATDIRNNVDFMNQVNQTYQYVQIPLQMNGQNVAGELYVYTNKKNMDEDGELSAFLHLDMENLGSTDVSVKMKDRNVDTKFYFDNDASYQLVMEHSEELAERLRRKGYNCKIAVVNEAKHLDFVEDFMKQDAKPIGLVHRYSFDMRA
ncbi:MAG: flagellar hook-length control protein FliK [Lachnospiraceae bacterium]|nr:flagellar hook-length control protein FliK [Lachnospiraceae bacterium]